MKIICNITNLEDAKILSGSNVHEFFCGVLDKNWIEKNSVSFSPNKRSRPNTSISSFEELGTCNLVAYENKKKLSFIINNFCTKSQKKQLIDMIEKVLKIGIENFIVIDFFTINYLVKKNVRPILSTTSPVLNSKSAKFYKNLGVKRIILPRDLSLPQIEKITKTVNLDYEVIILNEACPNIDGFCRFFHGRDNKNIPLPHACCLNYKIRLKTNSKLESLSKNEKIKKYNFLKNRFLHNLRNSNKCGVCFVFELEKIGITHLKIPSRGWASELKKKDIEFVNEIINNHKFDSKEKIKEFYIKTYNKDCGGNCYIK
jgi:U32 family peptidase